MAQVAFLTSSDPFQTASKLAVITAKVSDDIETEEERVDTDRQKVIHDLLNWLWSGVNQIYMN
jgi:hypothetical protein